MVTIFLVIIIDQSSVVCFCQECLDHLKEFVDKVQFLIHCQAILGSIPAEKKELNGYAQFFHPIQLFPFIEKAVKSTEPR